jgi:hypothetical protein
MIHAAKRWKRQSSVATWLLVSTVYLHAQAAAEEPLSNLSLIKMAVIVPLLIFIGILLWRAKRTNTNRTDLQTQPKPSVPKPTPGSFYIRQSAPVPLSKKPTGLIFISYRRQDSQHITGRIYDRLSAQFGTNSVFKDVDAIPLGVDFREHLQEKVGQCSVLIAVIGKDWNQTSASGTQRLTDPRDHLRIEIETALERRIPVIPVLVDSAAMPGENDLPPSLARLAYYNGISVRPDPDFHHDADRLLRGIESLLKA